MMSICGKAILFAALLSVSFAFVPSTNVWYKLKTHFQGDAKCLEGNRVHPSSTLSGAAFMDNCQDVSGQMWKFEPVAGSPGYYRMKTLFQGNNKCFEGNRLSATSTLKGAAFMDDCQNVSSQLWKIRPFAGSTTWLTLTTMFRESANECLEGNKFSPASTLGVLHS